MGEVPLKIALVAGEASGDKQGAALVAAVRERVSPRPVEAWGIGGDLMRDAGVDLRFDCGPWSTIGVAAVAANLPYLFKVKAEMHRLLVERRPDVLVLIDAGGFNVRLARWVKSQNICPVFYYFPPGSWQKQAMPTKGNFDLAHVTDRIVTPFPWSAATLKQAGADAFFVGHPLLDLVGSTMETAKFLDRFGLDPLRPLVALLPGSRRLEIQHILPVMIGAAGEIARRIPGVQFVLALAPTVPRGMVEEIIRAEQRHGGRAARLQLFIHQAGDRLAQIAHSTWTPPPPIMATNEGLTMPAPVPEEPAVAKERSTPAFAPLVICEDLTYDVIARSDLVITKSGTSTLEAAIQLKPMIIVYRGPKLMAAEWKFKKHFRNIQHIGLPNILAEERLFPELIQDEATPEAISELAVGILLQPERLLRLKKKLADLVETNLGLPGGVGRAADLLIETATGKRPEWRK